MLGKLLRDGVERMWAFSARIDTILNGTKKKIYGLFVIV